MFLKMLFILFIGLKLAGVIDWSWWIISIPAIILITRLIIIEIVQQSIKEGKPWAIKLALWSKS